MKYQRAVSLSLGLTFVVMLLSSGVLYFIPDRGVTAWSAWSFLGLDKQQWDNLHINLGLLFLVFLIWHIYYNWKPIKNYLKVKKEWVVFTKEFNFSLVLVSLFMMGTIWMILPFSFFVNIGNGIKAINIKENTPPFAYAEEATLRDFCLILDINLTKAIKIIHGDKKHIISQDETLKQIAKHKGTSARNIYAMIKTLGNKPTFPTDLTVGIAHKSIAELSRTYILDIKKTLKHLKSYGIDADKNTPFKKIAKTYHLHPATLYNMFLASQK
jgi:hypothetical protein